MYNSIECPFCGNNYAMGCPFLAKIIGKCVEIDNSKLSVAVS